MPNYDWKCRDCGGTFEKVTPSTVTETDCPLCVDKYGPGGGVGVAARQPSAPPFTVRGGTPRFHK